MKLFCTILTLVVFTFNLFSQHNHFIPAFDNKTNQMYFMNFNTEPPSFIKSENNLIKIPSIGLINSNKNYLFESFQQEVLIDVKKDSLFFNNNSFKCTNKRNSTVFVDKSFRTETHEVFLCNLNYTNNVKLNSDSVNTKFAISEFNVDSNKLLNSDTFFLKNSAIMYFIRNFKTISDYEIFFLDSKGFLFSYKKNGNSEKITILNTIDLIDNSFYTPDSTVSTCIHYLNNNIAVIRYNYTITEKIGSTTIKKSYLTFLILNLLNYKFINLSKYLTDNQITEDEKIYFSLTNLSVSPSGKIIYLISPNVEGNFNNALELHQILLDDSFEIIDYFLHKTHNVSDSLHILTNFLASNGKIYLFPHPVNAKNKDLFYFLVISRPDSFGENAHLLKIDNFYDKTGEKLDLTFPIFLLSQNNYISPKFLPLQKVCRGGGGKIPNLSDTSEYERFVWYLSDNDSLEGYEVQPAYSEPGKYLLKLKAYSKYGYYSWFSDSVIVTENPEPNFKVEADTSCQFVAFNFENTTDYRGFEPQEVEILWDFGDGQTSMEFNPKHTYKKSGNYTVKLTTSIGSGCKSTYEYPLNIVIKPAPEPKLILSDTVGCSPLTVSYSQAVTEEFLSIKHIVNGDTLAIEQGEVTYYEPGEYEITQIVEADNGCRPTLTNKITVYRGISPTETIKNLNASYTDSGVLVRWGALQGAAGYRVQYADEELVTNDLQLLHNTTEQFDYSITAIDSCGNMSQVAVISPIYLTGSTDPQNFAANLRWSSYPTPDYCVERLNSDSSWEQIGCVNSLNFSDEEFADDESYAERCYRVRSVTEPKSFSNVVCLPFVAQLWIPNAFSPNADGINDVWQLRGIGIKEIKVSVYNRWGQLVYDGGRLTDSWDGDNAQEGVYLYIVQYQENSGRKRLEKGVLRVVR